MNVPTLPPFDHQPAAYIGPSVAEVLKTRREFLNPGIFLYYKKPLMLVKGKMQYVWDEDGRRYLDALGSIRRRRLRQRTRCKLPARIRGDDVGNLRNHGCEPQARLLGTGGENEADGVCFRRG